MEPVSKEKNEARLLEQIWMKSRGGDRVPFSEKAGVIR